MYRLSEINKQIYKPGEVAKMLGVSLRTIQNYDIDNILNFERNDTNRRYITRDNLIEYLLSNGLVFNDDNLNKKDIVYARVSSNEQKQKGDLDRQALSIIERIPNLQNVLVLKEVGSGLNDKRKELNKLISMVLNDEINKIYVTYKDRLTRFGFNYIDTVCKAKGVEIVILNKNDDKDIEKELVEDMMNLIASFSGKLYGIRSSKNRKGVK